jgi:hypothetical protein
MENLTPEVQEVAGGAPELMEVAVGEAATATGREEATAPPEPALEVVVRSPEIQAANCTDEQYAELLEQMAPIAEQVADKLNLQ